jgi:hypothetical protein
MEGFDNCDQDKILKGIKMINSLYIIIVLSFSGNFK